jgi:hypothetical protein
MQHVACRTQQSKFFFSDKHLLGQDRFGPTNGIHIQAATVLE